PGAVCWRSLSGNDRVSECARSTVKTKGRREGAKDRRHPSVWMFVQIRASVRAEPRKRFDVEPCDRWDDEIRRGERLWRVGLRDGDGAQPRGTRRLESPDGILE